MKKSKIHLVAVFATGFFCTCAWATNPALQTLATFNGQNGAYPQTSLLIDPVGNIYGTAEYGGTGWTGPSLFGTGAGTVFEIPFSTHTLNTLVAFSAPSVGNPNAGLISDASGNLYGSTSAAGNESLGGTVFEISSANHALNTLVSFSGANGDAPIGNLTTDAHGNIYGATAYGGPGYTGVGYSGDGTFFAIPATGHVLNTLVYFNFNNGLNPEGALSTDATGNIFSTTAWGGAIGGGTVFEYSPTTNTLSTLVSFNGTNGQVPTSGLVLDSVGNLYGTTEGGGTNNDGTVFEISASTHMLTTIVNFTGANGNDPVSGLIIDAAGNLYGTTAEGGGKSDGSIFEISALNHTLTTLYSFSGPDGAGPYDSLVTDAAGNLYGTTRSGGLNNVGTVFELSNTGFVVAVPEPGSLSLLGIASLSLLRRRRWAFKSVRLPFTHN